MESRVMGNCHARFGAGENLEMISKSYLSLKVSTPQATVGVAPIKCDLFVGGKKSTHNRKNMIVN